MKKKNTNSRKKENKADKFVIDVSQRSRIYFENDIQSICDSTEQIDRLRKELDEITKAIEIKYYSQPSVIDSVQNRKFYDLVKSYIGSLYDKIHKQSV